MYNPFESAQTQFDNVASMINLEQSARDILREPMKEFHFTIPIKMDDGSTKIFKAFRIAHTLYTYVTGYIYALGKIS